MALEHYTILETHSVEMFTIHFLSNGIVHLEVAGDTVIDVKHIKAQFDFLKSRHDGKTKFTILVESGYDSTLTKEAREYTALSGSNVLTLATAVVVKSLAERLIINFIINITSRQSMKIRLFESKESAMKWLLSIKELSSPTTKNKLSACF
ncbi:MAG: hypothetical protein O9353_03345 [Bacteroidia bacterium]|nr:hypothetical protein [Bacteroidia bacterium]